MANRKAYSCIELMMVVMVVAIVIAFSLSGEDNVGKEKARLAAEKFEADVAYARRASIARPDDPVVIKLDEANNRYWLASASTPNTPLAHPMSGDPYIVNLGTGPSGEPQDVQLVAADFGGDAVLGFSATGTTDQATEAVLQLTASGAEYEVLVAPAGGQSTVNTNFTKNLVEPVEPMAPLTEEGAQGTVQVN